MKATIVWTVLPRGVRPNGDLELSVHLSPRLRPDGASAPLSTFRELQEPGDRDRNWASHAFSFGVEVASAAPTIGRARSYATVVADRARLDPRLWGRLLAGTEVRAHAPNDLRARKIRSFPVGHVHQF
ncbi:MAG: hypothetical protein KC636_07845, partial [Myxococcales bacterium]|nr:hypothetical protein [Myxococcales bacterium]